MFPAGGGRIQKTKEFSNSSDGAANVTRVIPKANYSSGQQGSSRELQRTLHM